MYNRNCDSEEKKNSGPAGSGLYRHLLCLTGLSRPAAKHMQAGPRKQTAEHMQAGPRKQTAEHMQAGTYRLTAALMLSGVLMLSGCRGTVDQGTLNQGAAQQGQKENNEAGASEGNRAETETSVKWENGAFSIDGAGASADGNIVTIKSAGTYRLNGDAAQGQIVIDAGKEDEIRLVLDNFSITNQESSAIYGVQSGCITVVLEEGTENYVSDGASYVYENAEEDEPDAAIFSKDDLVFEGTGTLSVEGNYQDAIRGKDDLTVRSGTYVIRAANDGIKGKDSVVVEDGTFTITAGADGIQSSNDTDAEKGTVKITGSELAIQAGKKGILAETALTIGGGTVQVDSGDDAIHANGDVTVTAGTLTLASGDDAVHADSRLVIDGGTITITESYEGLEGLSIDMNGGTVSLVAEDDGLNAAGGSDSSGNGGRGGDNPFAVTEDAYIRIAGGELTVSASGDGIDSNGNLMLEGGTIFVEGPISDGDGTLDYNGTGTITGGTFVGTGSSGMTQAFTDGSTQPAIVIYYTESQPAGTEISVTDSGGNTLLQTAPSKEFSSMIFSSEDLKDGNTYQVKTGDTITDITVDGSLTQSGTPSGRGGRMGRQGPNPRGTGNGFGDGAALGGEAPEGGAPGEGMPEGGAPEGGMPGGVRPEDGASGDGAVSKRGGMRGGGKMQGGGKQDESSIAAEE